MIGVKQDILEPPLGNCFAACVASILELPLEAVPNFVGDFQGNWFTQLLEWLAPLNMGAAFVEPVEGTTPPGYAILTCDYHGHTHCVVIKDGSIVWDPAPAEYPLSEIVPLAVTMFTVLNPSLILPNSLID